MRQSVRRIVESFKRLAIWVGRLSAEGWAQFKRFIGNTASGTPKSGWLARNLSQYWREASSTGQWGAPLVSAYKVSAKRLKQTLSSTVSGIVWVFKAGREATTSWFRGIGKRVTRSGSAKARKPDEYWWVGLAVRLGVIVIGASLIFLNYDPPREERPEPVFPDNPHIDVANSDVPVIIIEPDPAPKVLVGGPDDYPLAWADEFDRDGLPDGTKWSFDTRMNAEGWPNKERQYYAYARHKNSRVENGHLILQAHHETLNAEEYPDWGGQDYTSARLTSRGLGEWTYGFFEIRAKLPCGRGTWPAIWTLSTRPDMKWPRDGEIDIMEHVGHDPFRVHGTVHTGAFNHRRKNAKGSHIKRGDVCSEFHRYQMHWTPDWIRIGVDDEVYFEFENLKTGYEAWPFDEPQYLILNLAVGGRWAAQKGIDNDALPRSFEIDYVRVFQDPDMKPPVEPYQTVATD